MALDPSVHRDVPVALVWIDGREAVVARWLGDTAGIERVTGEPVRREKTVGHVRVDPALGHGGGPREEKLDHRRTGREHQYLEEVAARVPTTGRIAVIGPGPTRVRLVRVLQAMPSTNGGREITTEPSEALTGAQLVSRLRTLAGKPPRRLQPATQAVASR
jgi:hypothetical protein